MKTPKKSDEDRFLVEACELFRPVGLSTVAMAENNTIGRLCVLRRLDEKNPSVNVHCLQFYNTINTPLVELEWQLPIQTLTAEAIAWLGNRVVVGCSDGSILLVSPFVQEVKKIQLFATGIVAVCSYDSLLVVANESAELQFVELDGDVNVHVRKTIKFASNQRIVSLAASTRLSLVAATMLNAVVLVGVLNWRQETLSITQKENKATIVWTAVFVDDLLFTGDSRGQVVIHDAKTSSLIKSINTHEAEVLSLSTNGEVVFAAGVDYRIQVLKRVLGANGDFDWATVGQRILHKNDVRCMSSVGQWLVSGGAGHEILVSNKEFDVYFPFAGHSCSVAAQFILMPYANHVDLWKRAPPSADGRSSHKQRTVATDRAPLKLLELRPPNGALILQAALSPTGEHLVLLTTAALYVYQLEFAEAEQPVAPKRLTAVRMDARNPISAIFATRSAVFFARGHAEIVKLDFSSLIADVVAIRDSNTCITRLQGDEEGRRLIAKSSRSELFVIDLSNENQDVDERFVPLDCEHSISDFRLIESADQPTALLFVAGAQPSLHFVDLKEMKSQKAPIDLNGLFGTRELATDISEVAEDSIVVHGSRGNCCIVEKLSEVRSLVASTSVPLVPQRPTDGAGESAERERKWIVPVMPPPPSEAHWVPNEAEKSAVLITARPLHPPTVAPMQIRRFNRN